MVQLANRRLAMTLFSGDRCSYCHMVRIVLAEKG
ncbi:MAG: stringent starvation protein A, partial [Proteobacteria bacterium]|nr:stringent starvation protein A [Pseudomonadota bacterium]